MGSRRERARGPSRHELLEEEDVATGRGAPWLYVFLVVGALGLAADAFSTWREHVREREHASRRTAHD